MLLGVIEELEMPETDMRRRQAQQHGAALLAFTVDRIVAYGDAERPTTRNTQGRQRLRGEEFADRRAQHGAAVAHPRKRGTAGPLEMQIPMLAAGIDYLAQQQPTAIAQLRVVHAELVTGIDHRPRLRSAPQLGPGKQLGEQRRIRLGSIQVDQLHGLCTADHQLRITQRIGHYLAGKGIAEASEAVVELQISERGHKHTIEAKRLPCCLPYAPVSSDVIESRFR